MKKLTIEEIEDQEAKAEIWRQEEQERLSLKAFEKLLENPSKGS